jgi:hypothetical protein
MSFLLIPLTDADIQAAGPDHSIVNVVLELFENVTETHTSYRLTNSGLYLTIVDGVGFVGKLKPSDKYSGQFEMDKDFFAVEMNEVTEQLPVNFDTMSAEDLLLLVARYGVEV